MIAEFAEKSKHFFSIFLKKIKNLLLFFLDIGIMTVD